MELLDKLGIDWKLLLAQIVNFLIVLVILTKLIYKPLVKFLDERRQKIEDSLSEARQIKAELESLEGTKQAITLEAKRQAQVVIEQAEAEAGVRRQQVLERVKTEAAEVIADARRKFEAERDDALRELRREAAKLITQGVTRVVGKLPQGELDQQYVKEVAEELTRHKSKPS